MKPSEKILTIAKTYYEKSYGKKSIDVDWDLEPLAARMVEKAILDYLDEEYEKSVKDKVAGIPDEQKSSNGCPKCGGDWMATRLSGDITEPIKMRCSKCGYEPSYEDYAQIYSGLWRLCTTLFKLSGERNSPYSSYLEKDEKLKETKPNNSCPHCGGIVYFTPNMETRPFLLKLINEKKDIKMRVVPQLSKEIQEWCFAHGIGFANIKKHLFLNCPYLFICRDKLSIADNREIFDSYDGYFFEYDVLNDCEMKEIK